MNFILNLNKPARLSSARAVAAVKRLLPPGVKVGHAGTLDPFATGVLLILIGHATRRCEELMGLPKQYEATVKFGASTETDDLDSPERPTPGAKEVGAESVQQVVKTFVGEILQRPPIYSALKIGGQPAYKLSRDGKPPELAPRPVRVDRIEIISYAWPFLKLRIDCGRGTYIRSIARDIGEKLGVGGYLTELKRTRIGDYTIDRAVELAKLNGVDLLAALQGD